KPSAHVVSTASFAEPLFVISRSESCTLLNFIELPTLILPCLAHKKFRTEPARLSKRCEGLTFLAPHRAYHVVQVLHNFTRVQISDLDPRMFCRGKELNLFAKKMAIRELFVRCHKRVDRRSVVDDI